MFSRPLSYITWDVRSGDGAKHQVPVYDSTSSQLAVNKTSEQVEWSREEAGDLTRLRAGTQAQTGAGSCGDDHRINWGYAYAAAPTRAVEVGHRRSTVAGNAFVAERRRCRRRMTRECRAR